MKFSRRRSTTDCRYVVCPKCFVTLVLWKEAGGAEWGAHQEWHRQLEAAMPKNEERPQQSPAEQSPYPATNEDPQQSTDKPEDESNKGD